MQAQSEKVQAQSAKVQANDGFIKATKDVMRDAGFKATVDPAEFIQDLYDWRMKKYPAEAKSRYIPERDMLLNELNDRLAAEKLQAQERAKQGLPPDPPVSGNNFFTMTPAQKNVLYEKAMQRNNAAAPKP